MDPETLEILKALGRALIGFSKKMVEWEAQLQNFVTRNQAQIDALQKYCREHLPPPALAPPNSPALPPN